MQAHKKHVTHSQNVGDASVANPVQNLGSTECLDAVAGSHHDQTDSQEEDHDRETLGATPDIENLGERKASETRDEVGNDTGRCGQGVQVEAAGDIGLEDACDLLLQGVHEVDQVDAGVIQVSLLPH